MNTNNVAAVRRAGLSVLLAALSAVALPATAAPGVCTGNPTAKIDPLSQTVTETTGGVPTVVTLDGSKSTPANGNLTYAWQFVGSTPSGFTVTLHNANTATPTFTAPNVPSTGATLQFRLTVCGQSATSATTNINVTDVVLNSPPTAVATATPGNATEGTLVTLDGSGSFDLDPNTTLTYNWSQIGGTPAVTLAKSNPAGSIVTFTAPDTPITTGASLTFRLTVSDGSLTGTTDKIVNIVWTNDPPVASLVCPGGLIDVDEGGTVTLDGSGSTDSDGAIASYAWAQQAGLPNLDIGGLTTSSISFTAPQLGYQQLGFLGLVMTVTDNVGASNSASCNVVIHDITPPVIDVHDQNAEATSSAGASVAYSVSAQDAVDDEVPYTLPASACTPASGSVFAIGETTVHCGATDSAGNSASASFKVNVGDTTAPVLQPHADVGVEATSAAGAVVAFDAPVASDAVDAAPIVTCTPPSGSQFALGSTNVSCGVVDHVGNAGDSITFKVDVLDTTAPVVTPPADVTTEATGPQTAVAHGTATATDAVGVSSQSDDAPATFPVGATTIHWTATDAAGNTGSATSLVTVTDHTPPTIDAPAAVADVEATGPSGAVVTYTSPATHDLVDGLRTATCAPLSGTVFALGSTTVTCSATDDHGNAAATVSFDVKVVDTTPPTIDEQVAIPDVEATGPSGAVIAYSSPATHDAVDGDGMATCTPASGATYALGAHTFTCNATDAHGNHADATSFQVSVVDTTAPAIDTHVDITGVEATGPDGATVSYVAPTTTDIVDGPGTATCAPASGTTFAVGTSIVKCDAHDHAGNNATQTSFTIEVVDTTPPVIAAHGDVGPIEATSAAGAVVTYTLPGTTDIVDGAGTASCSPMSGSQFALGNTTVACAAIDHAGNHALTTYFQVTVRDQTAPVIGAHVDISTEATGPSGAVVSYTPPATSDAVDGAGAATCLPVSGSTFALGAHTVTCSAHDNAGNVSTPTSFQITVVDTTAPVIAPHADVSVNATGNSSALVTYALPTASDLVDGVVQVACAPASGSSFNVGSTTVNCSATDHAGNAASSSFKVVVSYAFNGFYRPVDNLPTVNVVKAGSAIPVKFDLGGNQGLNIFASGYPASVSTACNASATDAIEETVTAGGSSLSFDAASGQYIYVWKTDKAWAGGCRQLQVKLRDGSSRWAAFNFTR